MMFLYCLIIEVVLINLLSIPKDLMKKYLIVCLLSSLFIQTIDLPILQDVLFLELLCFFLFYSLERNITEILFYLSLLLIIKDVLILIPLNDIILLIFFILFTIILVNIKKQYPINNQNMYWGLLMSISIGTLCIYHMLYNDVLGELTISRNLIILLTLIMTICISYYLFFRYTKLYHEQELLNQAVNNFKNDQQNYSFLEKKNEELYKLKHDLKYEYLQMKEYVKDKEFESINQMIDDKISSLDIDSMLIVSGNKLFDSFMNMKLEKLKSNNILPITIISIQDISFIEDNHLNIIINYLFDIACDCIITKELEIKVIQDDCFFEIDFSILNGIENIDCTKYDTLKIIVKKYQGSLTITNSNNYIVISLMIPVIK